jgi:hypothetical protein
VRRAVWGEEVRGLGMTEEVTGKRNRVFDNTILQQRQHSRKVIHPTSKNDF